MEVTLITYTPHPELLSATAARLCYRDVSATDVYEQLGADDIEKILDIVIASGHHSVLEHVTFTFAVDGISRVLSHQLVRHRVGIAFSQQSQRYVRLTPSRYVQPPTIRSGPIEEECRAFFKTATDLYNRLLELGVPSEDARFVLPQAVETRLVMTANVRQLIHMYSINACFRSQWEFRRLMRSLRAVVATLSPRLASEMKIKCFAKGYCDEVKMCSELEGRMPRGPESSHASNWIRLDDLARSVGE